MKRSIVKGKKYNTDAERRLEIKDESGPWTNKQERRREDEKNRKYIRKHPNYMYGKEESIRRRKRRKRQLQ
jgi:hypothetical protein